jgi:ABC-type multidrug transport system fused ATPase/permease subunit
MNAKKGDGARIGLSYFLRVLRYVKPFWRSAVASAALTIGVSLLALLEPWPLKILFDSVLGRHPLPGLVEPLLAPLWENRLMLLVVVVAGGFGLTLVGNGLTVLNSYIQTRLEQGMILNFRSDLFRHAQRLSMAQHERRRTGGLIYAINFQADDAAGLAMAVQPLAQSALTLVGMFWLTWKIHPQMALLSLVVVPFLYYAVGYYMSHIQARLRDVKGLEAESLSIVHEAVSMMRVIVAFGRESHEFRRFRQQGKRAVNARVGVTVRQTLFSLGVNTTTAAGAALVLGFGIHQILAGRMTGGELLVVLSYVASIYGPLEAISTTVGSFQDRFVSLEMAFKVLDTQPEVRDARRSVSIGQASGHVAFEDVGFTYEGRSETLSGISFEATPGQIIGLVGPTGAGKTTLVSLLPRFYDPQQGRITLDGTDIRGIRLASLRKQISIVLQEPLLFSGTIADNIRYGRLDGTSVDIVEAAKAANAHDFIMHLPKQYETKLGERGVMLSGGERQRISVARAFLKNAPILVLDEPTSSIDSRTEEVILDALSRLMQGRTTFMIAHRLSTIRDPDLVLVLDGGRIVERGTPRELLDKDGLYRELYDVQAGVRGGMTPASLAPVGAVGGDQ